MPRLSADQWETIRAEREAGASLRDLAERHGITHQAIQKRAKAEEWADGLDVGDAVRRKVAEKVAGVVAAGNPQKRAKALDDAADRAAEVVRRHQDEPNSARERVYAGLKAHRAAVTKDEKQLAFEDLKAAKIASEALAIIHKMERQAWGLDAPQAAPTIVIERSYGTP
jgi:gas vesicle protein